MLEEILYKDEGRYTWLSSYIKRPVEEQALAQGRNGSMKCIGIEVCAVKYGDPAITLTPINSRQQAGNCFIQIPRDEETVRQLCAALMAAVKLGETP